MNKIINSEELSKWMKEKINSGLTLRSEKGIVNNERINIAWVCNETGERFVIQYDTIH